MNGMKENNKGGRFFNLSPNFLFLFIFFIFCVVSCVFLFNFCFLTGCFGNNIKLKKEVVLINPLEKKEPSVKKTNKEKKIDKDFENLQDTPTIKDKSSDSIGKILSLFASLITIIVLAFGILQYMANRDWIKDYKNEINDKMKTIKAEMQREMENQKSENKKDIALLIRNSIEETLLLSLEARKSIVSIYRDGIEKAIKTLESELKDKCGCDADLSDFASAFLNIVRKHDILVKLYSEDIEIVRRGLMEFMSIPFSEARYRLEILKSFYSNKKPELLPEINRALRLIDEMKN